jgi:hypothetical protein
MDVRAASRRRVREEAVGDLGAEGASPEAVLERLELQRTVVAMVEALDEPLRTTLLLRFFEGRAPAEIARAQGVPAGTVRWRISEGLRRLRERLDDAHGGRRASWRALLMPLAGPATSGEGGAMRPRSLPLAAKLAVLGATAAVVGVAGTALWLHRGERTTPTTTGAASATAQLSTATPSNRQEERTMNKPGTKTAAFFGVVLPALAASAEGAKPLPRDEAIAFCIEQREWIVQKCKEDFADLLVERVPPDKREARRKEWLKKLEEGGAGPLEVRKQKCAEELDKKAQLASISTYAGRDAVRACQKESDCKVALACARKFMFGGSPKP